ncbi:MAG: DNA polymerase III subunit beta [Planctomycetes bacterium]|nr:DNA polymerase III subunit beta [Planctomycetota bacterium]
MKILCDRTQLQEAVGVVSSVVPTKSPKPILHNLLLRVDDEGITLFATDLEMAAKTRLDAVKVSRKGLLLLPAREASALLRELSDPTVTMDSTDQRCRIESGGGSFVLLGEDPSQFPEEIKLVSNKRVELPAGRLLRMIQESAFAAAREETRYAINGVLFDLAAGCLRLVATDGRRLALSYQNIDAAQAEFKVVVPLRALTTLSRAIPEGSKDPLQIAVGDKQIEFTFGKTQLISQLLECRFPDYEGVVPKAADTSVEIQKAVLESALRKTAILCSDDLRMVKFEVGDQALRITAESSARGRADVSVDVNVKGAGGSINFNPDYILEALRVCQLDQVRLDMSDDSMPAKFTLGESFTYVVMPISGT